MPNPFQPDDDAALIRPLSDLYPATAHWIYIDATSAGLLPVTARNRAVEILDSLLVANVHQGLWPLMEQTCRARFSGLIGAEAQNISLVQSFTAILDRLARVPVSRPGGNLVLCTALSRPAFASFWREFARRESLEVREARFGIDGFDAACVDGLIDARTLLVALPAVSHLRGWRLPVAAVGRLCRDAGAFFLVDGTSSVGILHTDVVEDGISALVVAPDGNALGTCGLGFACLSDGWHERRPGTLRPRLSLSGHAATDFAGGHVRDAVEPPLSVLVTTCEVLGVFRDCGVARIERHALALAERMRRSLEELGLAVDRPAGAGPSSHIAVVGTPGALSDGITRDPALGSLAERLTAGRVRYAIRGGQLLFGFSLYNRLRDVMDVRGIAAQGR